MPATGTTPAIAARNDHAFTTGSGPGGRAELRAGGEHIGTCGIRATPRARR
ncbi:hypothetical protein I3F58_10220 [Streptomyces sp. MUM 203J]|uniref:hypothetical protein n=1 Tax=Streptomyces sp. MUM 203J TaxID=2791990 RepID=UPI001F04A176|nr:hypothetical protein [Streptomyces sp. MUM 203J]MCH0539931.1 hypothetical protein [Streptomyces sp. MUM 203J]